MSMLHSTITQPSHSRLASLHDCDRKYFYAYHLGLSSKNEFPPAFMGSCLHVGLDTWHRTGSAAEALAALDAAWGRRKHTGDWDWVGIGHASIVLRNYMDSKHAAGWEPMRIKRSDLSDRLLATDAKEAADGTLMLAEAGFVVDVPNMGTVLVKPDLLLRTVSGIRVVDHKTTTSYLGSRMYNATKYTHQLRVYAMAMSALLGEPVLEGATNGIYAGKTASSPTFKGNRFESYVFDYSAADFVETRAWYAAGRRRMQDIAEHATPTDTLAYPQNPSADCGYCDFNELCSAPDALRPGLIKMKYATKEA